MLCGVSLLCSVNIFALIVILFTSHSHWFLVYFASNAYTKMYVPVSLAQSHFSV